jgi:hypothetical protein
MNATSLLPDMLLEGGVDGKGEEGGHLKACQMPQIAAVEWPKDS